MNGRRRHASLKKTDTGNSITETDKREEERAMVKIGMINEQIEKAFTYHPPKEGQAEKYAQLRALVKVVAQDIDEKCPNSREKSLALTKLEEAMFWANASIARNE